MDINTYIFFGYSYSHVLFILKPSCKELNGIQMNKKVHSSFQYHVDAKHKLDISISLAPSCLFSRIDDILIEQKPMEKKKKRKVSFISSEEKAEKDSKPRLSVKEIKTALQKALPPPLVSSSESNDDTLCEKSLYLSEPIGTVINEYKRKETTTQDDGIESKYLLTLADGNCPKTTEYHNKIQKLSYWFIETAEEVDISSSENGFWKVAYLYEEKIDSSSSSSRYNLLGYITLFFFFAPFKKPRGGYVSRICQCLIFPTYQRKGHGAWMLESLYKYFSCATSKEKDVVEINVEDPAPSFVALRDKVDLRFFLESIVEPKDVNCSSSSVSLWDEKNSEYTPLTDAKAIQLGSQLKLTHRQVQRCYEMWKLMSLNEKEEESENEMKQFRIMVKKRLLKVYMEDLGALKTKEEQKQFLAEEFEKLLAHYQKIIQSCKKRS